MVSCEFKDGFSGSSRTDTTCVHKKKSLVGWDSHTPPLCLDLPNPSFWGCTSQPKSATLASAPSPAVYLERDSLYFSGVLTFWCSSTSLNYPNTHSHGSESMGLWNTWQPDVSTSNNNFEEKGIWVGCVILALLWYFSIYAHHFHVDVAQNEH